MHEVVELAARLRVEAGRRLVEEEQLGSADNADRHVEAAALPAGELPGPLVRVRREADGLDQFVDVPRPPDRVGRVGRVVRAEVRQQFAHPPLRMVTPGLQHHTDARPPLFVAAGRVDAEHPDPTGGPHPEALEDFDRRGLAGSVRAEQRQHLAGSGGEAHAR